MSLSRIERAWNAVKEHKQRRKAAKRAKRKQKETKAKAYAAQLKRADDLRRIKAPKSSADFVLRHDYEADKNGKCGRKHCPACGTPWFLQLAEQKAAVAAVAAVAQLDAKSVDNSAKLDPTTAATQDTNTASDSSTRGSRTSDSSTGSSSTAPSSDTVTVTPVRTAASAQPQEAKVDGSTAAAAAATTVSTIKPACPTAAPIMSDMLAFTRKVGPIIPTIMTAITLMLATAAAAAAAAAAPTPEQLAAISGAGLAPKTHISFLDNLSGSKAGKGAGSKAAGALPGSPTSPGSPLIMAVGTAAAVDGDGSSTAGPAKSVMGIKQEIVKGRKAARAAAACADTSASDSIKMVKKRVQGKVMPSSMLLRCRSASVSMWAKATKGLAAPFTRDNKAAVGSARVKA